MQSVAYYSDLSDRTNNYATDEIFLKVNCAGHAMYPYRPVGDSVRRDYYLLYLTSGEFIIDRPQVSRPMQAGDLVVFEAGKPFTYRAISDGVDYYWVHFTGSDAQKLLDGTRIPLNAVTDLGMNESVTEAFGTLFLAFMRQDPLHELSLSNALLALLITVGEALAKSRAVDSSASALVARSTAYIHENIDKPLTVDALARREFLSPGRYREIFREALGISPQEYILRLRTNIACDLLRHTDASIATIALQVGYPDARYFSRLFRNRIGRTPSAYRKKRS